MRKILKGAAIGFLVAGGLGFLVVTGVFSQNRNQDMANYAFLYGILYSPLAALVGGVVGAVIGALADWRGKGERGVRREEGATVGKVLRFLFGLAGVSLAIGGTFTSGLFVVLLCTGELGGRTELLGFSLMAALVGFLLCVSWAAWWSWQAWK